MSKLIVEMEMPTVCDECPMMYDGIVCAATGTEAYPNRQARILKNGRAFDPCENRLDDCPIKGVLPETHGDLVDRDALKKQKIYSHERHEYIVPVAYVDWQQAVVTAERKDDE